MGSTPAASANLEDNMSSLIDYLMETEENTVLCNKLDCLYNKDGKCTQGITCILDESYDKTWFKDNEEQTCN